VAERVHTDQQVGDELTELTAAVRDEQEGDRTC
jgi:hypothetical protein